MRYAKIIMTSIVIIMIIIMGFIKQYSFNLGLFFGIAGVPAAIMLMVEITVKNGIKKHGRDEYYKIASDRVNNKNQQNL